MKVELKQSLLKEAMEAVSVTVSKENTRLDLTCIEVTVSRFGVMTLTSVDGYRVMTCQVPCISNDNTEEVKFLIKPFKIDKPNKFDHCEIEVEDETVYFTSCELVKYAYPRQIHGFVKVDKFFEQENTSLEIAFNPKYLSDLGKQFKNDKMIKLSFTTNINPVIVDNMKNKKAIILPIRINK